MRLTLNTKRSRLHLVEPGAPLPVPDASYDRVYTESVLGFQDEPGAKAMLAEIYRVLAPGGRYVANEAIWRDGVAHERIASINAACLADFGGRMASDAPWALGDWLSLMKQQGFQVVSSRNLEEHIATTEAQRSRLTPRLITSTALTAFYKLHSHLSPATRRARTRYRILNETHRDDGLYIEPRLFVLEKPLSATPGQ
jgi:ubiquinone/menaquinone biosynthesis C-methylase UbiE